MCVLVTVMCVGLVLLETGAVGHPRADCALQCMPKCQLLVSKMQQSSFHCCDCAVLCEKSCELRPNMDSVVPDIQTVHIEPPRNEVSHNSQTSKTLCSKGDCDLPIRDWKNLLASCGPCRSKRKSRSPMLREAALIARSVGLSLGASDGTVEEETSSDDLEVKEKQMSVRLVAMVRGPEVVATRITWDPQAEAGGWYLVTWEPEDGGPRGNLLTNSSTASLTLWPDTVYHVQITTVDSGEKSECLEVDTHTPPPSQPLTLEEGAAGAAAAVVVFLAFLLLFSRRWRHKSSILSEQVNQLGDHDHFKLYPPPVTLLLEPPPAPPQPPPPL